MNNTSNSVLIDLETTKIKLLRLEMGEITKKIEALEEKRDTLANRCEYLIDAVNSRKSDEDGSQKK